MLRDAMPINNGIKDNRQCLLLLLCFTKSNALSVINFENRVSKSATQYMYILVQFYVCDSVTGCLLYRYSFIRSFNRSHSDGFISNAHCTHSLFGQRSASQFAIDQYHLHVMLVTRSRAHTHTVCSFFSFHFIPF